MFFDFRFLMFMVPAMLLAGLATIYTKSTFTKYANRRASSGLTGAQAAARMLQMQGINNVRIEPVQGFLSDHYDPLKRVLRLSPDVYASTSLSAIGVACHEAGHALQHARRYVPLSLRSALVPAAGIGSQAAYFLAMIGLFMNTPVLYELAAMVFTAVVAFSLITLPVEWDASARAKRLMVSSGIVSPQEQVMAGSVLNAAFLTYVASALTAVLTLIYYLIRARR
ncbi:MAG: zinc metallopeptidase [Verrucomicrobia bacterium]|nr:zinc metallopeptidase [Verrucomicrobiota bacterium]